MERKTHTIDASEKSLGRLASEVAALLRGKGSPDFERHKDGNDAVHVFNLDAVKLTGNKIDQKTYYRHSGYPGGLKETKLKKIMEKDPGDALKRAVYGMLPKNKLRVRAMRRFFTHRKEIK